MTISKNLTLLIFFIFILSKVISQVNSPFSTAETGRSLGFNFSQSILMGAGAAAYNTPNVLNTLNPASYTATNLTNIDFGIMSEGLSSSIGQNNRSSGNIGITHLSFSMPIMPSKIGLAFGISKNYSTSYNFEGKVNDQNFGNINQKIEGEGNLYNIFVGSGYKYKNFSFGANLRIEFGNIKQNSFLIFPDSLSLPTSKFQIDRAFLNMQYNIGAQYQHFINKKSNFTVGGYYLSDFSNSVSQADRTYTITTVGRQVFTNETSNELSSGSIGRFSQLGFGANYTSNYNTTFGLEFEYRDFSNRINTLTGEKLQQAWAINTGVEYKPILHPSANTRKFFQRAIYRMGISAGQSENSIGTGLTEVRLRGGVSIPVLSRNISYLTLGGEWHQIGFDSNNISESYLRVFVQFTFSDRWFIRSKFD